MRQKLPQRRFSETFDIVFPVHSFNRYAVTVGCYPDGAIGEVFIASYQKAGSMADLAARDLAVLISLGLQHGIGLKTMFDATTKTATGEPEGLAGVALQALIEWRPS